MLGWIDGLLRLASSVVEFLTLKEQRKYVDRLFEIKKEILDERAKGQDADDAKLQALYAEGELAVTALTQAVQQATTK